MKRKTLLITAAAITFAAGANAQYSQYGAIENFDQANPDLINSSRYAGRLGNPNYLLVDWDRRNEMDSRMSGGGFVRLGVSSWENHDAYDGGGVPQRDLAIAYARAIGADIIIYSTWGDYPVTQHWVAFYAKQGNEVRRAAPTVWRAFLPGRG